MNALLVIEMSINDLKWTEGKANFRSYKSLQLIGKQVGEYFLIRTLFWDDRVGR